MTELAQHYESDLPNSNHENFKSAFEALPSIQDNEQEPPITAKFNFVLCEHTVQNAARIAEALKGSDVIVLEAIGNIEDDYLRREYDNALTDYVAPGVSAEYLEALTTYFLGPIEDRRPNDSLYLEILKPFLGTGIKVQTMDMNNDNSVFENVVEQMDKRKDLLDALHQKVPLSDLSKKVGAYITAAAASHEERERIMAGQLREIGRQNPGLTIGVMTGMMHSPIQHDLARDCKTTRHFIGSKDGSLPHGVKAQYTDMNQMIRMKRFGLEIPEKLINHEVVFESLLSEHGENSYSRADLEKLSDDAIQGMYEQIDATNTAKKIEQPVNQT